MSAGVRPAVFVVVVVVAGVGAVIPTVGTRRGAFSSVAAVWVGEGFGFESSRSASASAPATTIASTSETTILKNRSSAVRILPWRLRRRIVLPTAMVRLPHDPFRVRVSGATIGHFRYRRILKSGEFARAG